METHAAFKEHVDTLIAASSSILSSFLGQGQYVNIFFEDAHFSSLFATCPPSTPLAALSFEEKVGSHQGTGVHAIKGSENRYKFIEGVPTPSEIRACAHGLGLHTSSSEPTVKLNSTKSIGEEYGTLPYASHFEKTQFMRDVIEATYSYEPELHEVSVEYQARARKKCIISSPGKIILTQESILGLCLRVSKKIEGETVQVVSTHLTPNQYGNLTLDSVLEQIKSTTRQLIHQSSTKPIQSGPMPVVFEGRPTTQLPYSVGNAGIWLHETMGHLLEADQYNTYPIAGIGERCTAIPISISDDPNHVSLYERSTHDDEGTPTECSDLIVDGFLHQVLTDRFHAAQLHMTRTGNGRRQNYRHAPLPRMTTLFMHPGIATNESLIGGVKEGIYVKSISHGQTHADNQQIRLDVREGYYIKNGRLTHPVSNVTIEGKGLEILNHIEGVGNDPPSTPQMVLCKKKEQVVPVCVASPTVSIRCMNVYQHS